MAIASATFPGNSSYRYDLEAGWVTPTRLRVWVNVTKTWGSGYSTSAPQAWSVWIDGVRHAGTWTYNFTASTPQTITVMIVEQETGYGTHSFSAQVTMSAGFGTVDRSGSLHSAPPATTPGAPNLVAAIDQITSTSMHYNFTGTTDGGSAISRWEAERATDANFTQNKSTVVANDGHYYSTGLTPNTRYYFRARAINGVGWGAYGAHANAMTLPPPIVPPAAPTSYSMRDVASTTAYTTGIAVSNNGGADITDYRVQVNTQQNETGAVIFTADGAWDPFLHSLTPGTLYHYRVGTANRAGWSAWGEWKTFTTKNNVPTKPLNVAVSSITDSGATVSWDTPSNLMGAIVQGYTIRIARDRAFSAGNQTFSVPTGDNSYPITGLQTNVAHYVQVWANTNNGIGSFSDRIQFNTTGASTGSNDLWLKILNVWRAGQLWLKINNVWRPGVLWVKVDGVWRRKT